MEKLLTRKELRQALGVSERTVARYVQLDMPRHRSGFKGRIHRYSLGDVQKWLDNYTVEGREL